MTWFEALTGFPERSPNQVRENIVMGEETLTSRANGRKMVCGRLETPSLAELRERAHSAGRGRRQLRVRYLAADVQTLHADPANAGALFQVASQFNLLEMVSPDVAPERGVGIYENDHTQGPACAIAAGAGTIYRNYFIPLAGQRGQTATTQIDCLAELGAELGNDAGRLWRMQNGYALATAEGLREIAARLNAADEAELHRLRGLLRIGIQWHTEVTVGECGHLVSQAYCSALPVAYSPYSSEAWEAFARLVLEAAYEATLCAAVENSLSTGNRSVFLTLLGGGAFGNAPHWITDAIERALSLHSGSGLDVACVGRGEPKPWLRHLVDRFTSAGAPRKGP